MELRYTDAEKAEECARELKLRRRVYPDMVEGRKLKQSTATYRIALMEEIGAEYRERAHAGDLLGKGKL